MVIFIFIFGLVIGSFLTAFTYRLTVGESVVKGRSKCDTCGALIRWYDNIPLISYFLLSGKCRNCGKKISMRYPIIELCTGILFVLVFSFKGSAPPGISAFEDMQGGFILLPVIYKLLITSIFIAIFIIDLENQIIPDELVFVLFFVQFIAILLTGGDKIYEFLFAGFAAGSMILSINLVTFGKGMGLGDAKLALIPGLFFGFPEVIVWFFSSFVIGAIVGVVLILLRKADFGKRIAFGPFMVLAFFCTWFWGDCLFRVLLPFY